MSLWSLQNERDRWRRTPYVTKKHLHHNQRNHHNHHNHHHHHKHRPKNDFQHLLQDTPYTLQDGIESDDDCFAGNKGGESDADTSDNDSDIGDIDDKVYNWLP